MFALLLTAVPVADALAAAPRDHWVSAWATAQTLAVAERPFPGPPPEPARVSAQTVRMVARTTIAGRSLRVALSNRFGAAPLRIDASAIGVHAGNGALRPGTRRALTFGGLPHVVLAPGAQLYSDDVDLPVAAQTDLAISLYVAGDSDLPTSHALGLRTAWIAPGDQSGADRLQDAKAFRSYLWLAGIDVLAAPTAAAIVAFGDSITDGYSTTPDADMPWPSILARRFGAQRGAPPRAVLNMGISGNRVLREGAGSSALARFERDVLARPGVRWIVLLEGINDINISAIPGLPDSEKATAAEIIAGYRQLISRARLHGLRIIGATLMPCEGIPVYTEAGERMRQEVNRWIRESGAFDAVIDFDASTRDPARPSRLRAEYDSGDHIHPNDAGNQAMADAVDLKLFR